MSNYMKEKTLQKKLMIKWKKHKQLQEKLWQKQNKLMIKSILLCQKHFNKEVKE